MAHAVKLQPNVFMAERPSYHQHRQEERLSIEWGWLNRPDATLERQEHLSD
jgi:hypothetical protein